MRANRVMTRDVVCIPDRMPLADAYELMMTKSVRHLPVVEGRALIGILSDRDLLLRANQADDGSVTFPDRPVKDAMTTTPITCTTGTTVSTVAKLMLENKIDCIPVVSIHGELVGLITTTDLIELCRGEEKDAEPVPMEFSVTYPGHAR